MSPDLPAACLGVDAGGTKSAWVLTDEAGTEIARGRGAGIQAAALGVDRCAAALTELANEVVRAHRVSLAAFVSGVAGAGRVAVRRAVRTELERSLGPAARIAVVGDPEAAAAAALDARSGVAAWAGTGSFVVARSDAGSLHRVGGRGWLLDDRGGAFALVRAAAVAASEAADGVGEPTDLLGVFEAELNLARPVDLGAALVAMSPRDVAALLPAVADVAESGDMAACAAFDVEAHALAARVMAAMGHADLPGLPSELPVGGGVLGHCEPFRDAFQTALIERGFDVELGEGIEASVGAARLAVALRTGSQPLVTWTGDDHAA